MAWDWLLGKDKARVIFCGWRKLRNWSELPLVNTLSAGWQEMSSLKNTRNISL